MMRGSGVWTTYEGRQRRVGSRFDLDTLALLDPETQTRVTDTVAASDLGPVERVHTEAEWRGGRIIISVVGASDVGFYTDDADLAEREGLRGDRYSGWNGSADLSELTDVTETITLVRETDGGALR